MYETQKKRRIRRPAAWLLAVLLTGVLCCQAVWADQRTLIPVGKAVGIKLFADGVLVVSTSETDPCPARDCGIREGDLIVSCNGEKVTSTEDLQALLQATGGQSAAIGLRREGKTLNVTAVPVQAEDGSWRLGAWTRDSMAGVGTLTFYDPDTGAYGALGHGITDTDTAQLMPLSSGSIMETSVKAVKKGEKGEPGQLKGDFTAQHDVGTVSANTTGGIFGTVAEGDFVSGTALPVAQRSQVTTGPATILSTVSGDDTRAYQVEIVRLSLPDDSYEALDDMVAHVEGLVKSLGLPYRILRLCGGDMSFTSALTYDFEVYSEAQKRWLEVSSVSNFESFQANRLKLRYRDANKKIHLAHTLNGSSLALPRIVAALLENNQTHEGIRIPEGLMPYTGLGKNK